MQASGQAPAALAVKLPTFLKDAEAFLTEGLEAGEPQQRQQTLGELLLGLPPPAPAQSHLSDAGLVLDHQPVPAAAAAAVAAMAAAEVSGAAAQQQQQGGEARPTQEQQQQQAEDDPESIAAMLQESLLQANGANRAELEAMLIR